MRHIAAALLLIAACPGAAQPTSITDPFDPDQHARLLAAGTLHRCDFAAYSIVREPVAVRAAPRDDARLTGSLPPAQYDPDLERDIGPYIDVLEARDGWFRVSSLDPVLEGWIPGRYLEFDLQTDVAFAAPDTAAAVVATSWHTPEGHWPFAWREPSDCKGKWVKARFAGRDGIEREGWAAGVCANQDTTCDGVYGTWLPGRDE